ncbi:hypothetical protein [Falsiporphyromonas endometrii]|uniref:Lipoprotein n=1 Tax=Falsiporphyromonas endometrii TaxID=1387297 RepID=A0ABV9K529_9PORP
MSLPKHFFILFILLFSLITVAGTSCTSTKKDQVQETMNQADSILSNCNMVDQERITACISELKNIKSGKHSIDVDAALNEYIRKLETCKTVKLISSLEHDYNTLMHSAFSQLDEAVNFSQTLLNKLSAVAVDGLSSENREAIDQWRIGVSKVLSSFKSMKGRVFYESPEQTSLAELRRRIALYGKDYKDDSYETVRMNWKIFCLDALKTQAMTDLYHSSEKLPEQLRTSALEIADNSFSGFVINYKNPPEPLSNVVIKRYSNELRVEGEVTYFIYMKGNIFGIERGSVKVRVKGAYIVVKDDKQIPLRVEYRLLDAKVFDKTGDL